MAANLQEMCLYEIRLLISGLKKKLGRSWPRPTLILLQGWIYQLGAEIRAAVAVSGEFSFLHDIDVDKQICNFPARAKQSRMMVIISYE